MVGCSHDPSTEKYKLYHFVFQITSIDCSVRKVTCHQLSHWPAGKLLPVLHSALGPTGAQAHCVYTVQLGRWHPFPKTISCNRTASWSAEMGRSEAAGKGWLWEWAHPFPRWRPRPPAPATWPACIHQELIGFLLFASKLPGPNPVYASKPYAKDFNILYIFSGSQKKKMLPRRRQGKNQIKKQLCIRKPEALK